MPHRAAAQSRDRRLMADEELRPPYFFTGHAPDTSVEVTADFATAVVELVVSGRWSQHLGVDVSAAIRKCLAQPPSAIIVNLHGLADSDGASMPLWLAVRRAAHLLQPPVQVALCLPAGAGLDRELRRSGAEWHLFMFPAMAAARAAVAAHLPLAEQLEIRLPPDPASAAVARRLVGQACAKWQLPKLELRARMVMSELVANAIEHAGTDSWACISRRGTGLHLAVSDGVARLPELQDPPLGPMATGRLSKRGLGLRLVHSGAHAWGAMPTQGGKVVWATVCPRKDD
ncbi:MAG: ATP-binding protein [Actinoplanes sp.]